MTGLAATALQSLCVFRSGFDVVSSKAAFDGTELWKEMN